MKLKKLTALFMSAVMLLSVTACSGKSDNSSAGDASAASQPAAEPATLDRNDPMNITDSAELVSKMKIGWNLGNTLDATGGEGVGSETSWGNPRTKKKMITKVSSTGFNVIRIPVSWGGHVDENWVIDPEWFDRVQTVVNYGYDNGMYVILNTHHEEWYYPDEEHAAEDIEHLGKIWQQIAERFRNYGERLLFEGLNEPRLRGTGKEWTGNAEARGVINRYEQKFVDTVRATGGNNAKRALVISPYAASSAAGNLKAVVVPENAGNVIVSVHAYLPYDFALNTKGTSTYKDDGSIKSLMKNIKEIFLDKGISVIITEFGCMNKTNTMERLNNITDFLTASNEIGVPCVWWDNGYALGTTGETFGLLNREDVVWYFPEIAEKLVELTKNRGEQNAPAAAA